MSAPNMLSLTSITGNETSVALSTTGATQLLSNAAASNQLLKVNAIYASNTDTVARIITINNYSAAALGGTAYSLVTNLSVPAASTIVIVDKDSNLYKPENTSLGATATTANTIVVTVSYEICQ